MKRRSGYGNRTVFWIIGFLLGVIGWIQLLTPPLQAYWKHPSGGFGRVILELLSPSNSIYEEPYIGWLFLLLTAALIALVVNGTRAFGEYLEVSRVGISVVETRMDLVMETADRSRATFRRAQIFHANRGGITAYHLVHRTDEPAGKVDLASIKLASQVGGKAITQELLKRGTEKAVDLIEVYANELPRDFFATYLPK